MADVIFSKPKLNHSLHSSKHLYDDVFSSPPHLAATSSCSFSIDDYGDIFGSLGGSGGGGGGGRERSSVPIIDMPDYDRSSSRRMEKSVDYEGIFGGGGGLGDDDDEVMLTERSSVEKSRSSAASTINSNGSKLSNGSYANQTPSKLSSSRSSDSVENINVSCHRSTTTVEEPKRGGTYIAEVQAVPGFASVHDEVGPSRKKAAVDSVQVKMADDSIYMDFRVGKKQRKHSREFIPHDAPVEKSVRLERGDTGSSAFCPSEKSQNISRVSSKEEPCNAIPMPISPGSIFGPFDKSQNISGVSSKEVPCNVMPMPISPQSSHAEGELRRSSTSSFKDCEVAAGDSSPTFSSLSGELDANSDAAVCAAAVKLAIEEAKALIRLAIEVRERNDGHGFAKTTFRDHRKFKVMKDDKHVSHENGSEENDLDENTGKVDPPVVSSVIEEENAREAGQVPLESRAQKEVLEDLEIKNNANTNELISTQGSNSSEGGGEWEAARHLSQLFTGVKNRLASFMAWQGDGEKKPTQKEAAPVSGSLDQSNGCEWIEKDPNLVEEEETNGDLDTVASVSGEERDRNKMASTSGVNRLEANDLKGNGLQQETIYMGFNIWPAANDMKPNDLHVEETLTENQESLGSGFCSEEYEVSAVDAAESAIVDKISDQAECMTESDGKDVPDSSMNSSCDRKCGTDMEEMKERETQMQKLVPEHHVELEVRNETFTAGAILDEDQHIDIYKLEEIHHVDKQADSGVAEGLRNSIVTDLTGKNRGEEEEEDASTRNEVQENKRQSAHEVVAQQQCSSDKVSQTYHVMEIAGEDCGEDVSIPSDDAHNGIETEPRAFLDPEKDRKLLNSADLVGEIREGAAKEDADKSEENQVRGEIEQEVLVEQQEVAGMLTEASLLDETRELKGAQDACKWEENEETSKDARHRDVIHHIDEANFLIEETGASIMNDKDMAMAHDIPRHEEGEFFSRNEAHQQDDSSKSDEEVANPRMAETSFNSEPEVKNGEPISVQMSQVYTEVLFTSVSAEADVELERFLENNDAPEGIVLPEIETDGSTYSEPIDVEVKGPTSDSNLEKDVNMLVNEFGESGNVSRKSPVVNQETEKLGIEATHKRRRWFEGMDKVGSSPQPSPLVGEMGAMKFDEETGRTTVSDDAVETHIEELVIKFGEGITVEAAGAATDLNSDTTVNLEKGKDNIETIHKRRRWFEDREEGVSQPSSVSVEDGTSVDVVHESVNSSGECSDKKAADINNVRPAHTHRRRRWFEKGEELEPDKEPIILEDSVANSVVDQEADSDRTRAAWSKHGESSGVKETTDANDQVKNGNELHLANHEERERRRQRLAVERAFHEVRDRVLAAVVDKPVGDGQEKASTEAEHRAQRAAVERANAEALERLQKEIREQAARSGAALDPKSHSSKSFSPSNSGPLSTDGASGELPRRLKVRQEKNKPTIDERKAKALEEKKMRDLIAQQEQADRNRVADALDAQVKRWSNGKEGNLRALLSTLQYILEPKSGWQSIPMTDLVASTAAKKAYKKAALCVHPDKVQQRGADIMQKYICEKVFDLLKEAWDKFSGDER